MQTTRWLACVAAFACASVSAAPVFRNDTCAVRLDGVRVGGDLTAGNSSLRNTLAYDAAGGLYHFWGFVADDASFPSAASAVPAVRHATSSDGVHFTSDANLSYAAAGASYTTFGADIDPPLDFFRAAFDAASGTWKLFNWSGNDQLASPSFGQYNYNTSVNDLGADPGNTAVVHQGPLNTPVAGNHVGTFGLFGSTLVLRVDGGAADGGAGQFAYSDGTPPSTGAMGVEANLFAATPYCWLLDVACGTPTDPRVPAYVHNVGRTLAQADGSIGTFYNFRHADGSRIEKQIWYTESRDGGTTWSLPAPLIVAGDAVTVEGQALAADGYFGNVDVLRGARGERIYFSSKDAAGRTIFVTAPALAADLLFEDNFGGCND